MAEEKKPAKRQSIWEPVLPVPESAPDVKPRHSQRGEPLRVFIYRNAENYLLGYTCRFITSSGEPIHLPLTWCKDQVEGNFGWRWIQFPRLRPLYDLDLLAKADPESDQVLLVFDELSAEHAKRLVPWLTPVSWPGGVRKIDEVDWSPLKGRSVWIFPPRTQAHGKPLRRDVPDQAGEILPRDRQPGWQAALKLERILRSYGCVVPAIFDPFADDSLPADWDIGVAGESNWTEQQLNDWMLAHMTDGEGTEAQKRLRALRGLTEVPAQQVETIRDMTWADRLIYKRGELSACLSNVFDILANEPEWDGVVAYNEFAQRVVKLKPPPFPGGAIGGWEQTDDSFAAMWLQRRFGFTPSSLVVAEAINALARARKFHPVREWLNTLVWDRIPRIDDWAVDYLNVPKTEYSTLVSRYFLIAMVARVMKPGCKFDYCLVLEGSQGKGKSSALRILGGEWFGDTDIDLHNKDAMSALNGKWLYEFAELDALARAEWSRVKSFISRQNDEYRPVWERREITVPRQTCLTGSTNEGEWIKDTTGGRRFWALHVPPGQDINLEGLRENRDQLFAEALVRFNAEERYHPTFEEQKRLFDPEQLRREQQESLVDALHDWVYQRLREFSVADAMMEGLKLDASKMTRDMQTRVGIALRKLGCTRVERRNGMIRYWYKPPEKTAESKSGQHAQQETGVSDVGF